MDRVEITFNLSRELTDQAQEVGILTDEWMERLIWAELERRQLDPLNLTEPAMTPEQIQAEIDEYRREKREPPSGRKFRIAATGGRKPSGYELKTPENRLKPTRGSHVRMGTVINNTLAIDKSRTHNITNISMSRITASRQRAGLLACLSIPTAISGRKFAEFVARHTNQGTWGFVARGLLATGGATAQAR